MSSNFQAFFLQETVSSSSCPLFLVPEHNLHSNRDSVSKPVETRVPQKSPQRSQATIFIIEDGAISGMLQPSSLAVCPVFILLRLLWSLACHYYRSQVEFILFTV